MARTRKQKKQLIEEYTEKIQNAKAIFIVEPNALTANQSVEIKKQLFDLDADFNVIKNSLFKIALQECSIEESTGIEKKPKAVVFTKDKISEAAKVIKEFINENKEKIEIKFGFLDKEKIEKEDIVELAELPSYDIMLAKTLATMNAPISGFVKVLAGNITGFINVVNAIKKEKQ